MHTHTPLRHTHHMHTTVCKNTGTHTHTRTHYCPKVGLVLPSCATLKVAGGTIGDFLGTSLGLGCTCRGTLESPGQGRAPVPPFLQPHPRNWHSPGSGMQGWSRGLGGGSTEPHQTTSPTLEEMR